MRTAVALGNFDGVHKAHAALIGNMTAYAKEKDLQSVAYVFEPHTRMILFPEKPPALLMTPEIKYRRLKELGVSEIWAEKRGKDILGLSPAAFVREILCNTLHAAFVTAGFNYRFGKDAVGDAAALQSLCRESGIACTIMQGMEDDGKIISSTRLRHALQGGDVESVNRLSFAPYTIDGIVQTGKHLGRRLGFPTVNMEIPPVLLLPKKGVYISRTTVRQKTYQSITNIGENPTVENVRPRSESFLFDFSQEVYGEKAEITLLHFVRPQIRFDSVSDLQAQLTKDIQTAKQYFERKDIYGRDMA